MDGRRHARRAMTSVVALSLVAAAACQLVAGIDGIAYAPSDAGADGGKRDAVVLACPDPADCTNPACVKAGYQCLPAPHEGGVLVAAAFDASLVCPPGYGAPAQWFTLPSDAGAQCSCACTLDAAPSCGIGILTVFEGSAASCMDPDDITVPGPGCTTQSGLDLHSYLQVAQIPGAMGGACSPSVVSDRPEPAAPVGVCTATRTSHVGCAAEEVCALNSASTKACVEGDLPTGCGVGYASFRPLAHSVEDTRRCQGQCQCAPPSATCAATSLTFFTEADCGGAPIPVDTNGQCNAAGSGQMQVASFESFEYVAATSQVMCGAGVGPLDATGGVVVTGATTFCCAE